MTMDPMKTTKDFLDSIVAQKAPSVYLPESTYQASTLEGVIGRGRQSAYESRKDLSLRILMLAAGPIPPPFTDMFQQIGVSRTAGARLVKELINSGLVVEKQYHPARRGGGIKLPCITDAGVAELKRFGIKPPARVIQGSWDHNLCGTALGEIGKRKHYRVFYEVPIGPEKDVRIDVVWQAPDGSRVFWQCVFSSAEREVEAALRAVKTPAITNAKLGLVCANKTLADRVSNLLQKTDCYRDIQPYVSIKLCGDVLEHYYKKSEGSLL
jgi:DNA-binding Lrp family transcriptional regulator